MPADVGNQTLSLKFGAVGNSREVNERFVNVRPVGIYSGGYLSLVDASNASLSPLVCEIGDGTHQLRIETTSAVTVAVASATPYVVLRWSYTGTSSDYMQILAVAGGSVLTNDVVVGLCTFTGGGSLNGFTYENRTNPLLMELFLNVEPTEITELKVQIRGGWIQDANATIDIPDQKSSLFTTPSVSSRIDLVYVDRTAKTIAIQQGVESASPLAPAYAGKVVLAEVTLQKSSTNITADMIKDVRNFVDPLTNVDDASIELDSNGKISVKDRGITEAMLATAISDGLARIFGPWTNLDSLGSTLARNLVYKATSDGFVSVWGLQTGGSPIRGFTDSSNPPTTKRVAGHYPNPGNEESIMMPVRKNDYFKIESNYAAPTIYWLPMGSGQCVKQ
jgi:hypothetical protein